jgi:cellulose synthase/poly-beta-1,6-N-acetylglucosamine synthase-like glycosyltransferase
MIATLIFFVLYVIVIGIIVSVGFVKQRSKENHYRRDEVKIDPSEITVLIPFRNEQNRIYGLLNSINDLDIQVKEFIFINDHSDELDQSSYIIQTRLEIENYSILDLPEGITGKKRALRFASDKIETKYTLTIDADVQFDTSYISSLAKLGDADMYVLPAVMISMKWYEHFYEIDLLLVTAANTGLSGLSRPIMASGANLLYKTETFRKVDNLESHINMASGDDTYLLRDFRENNADVRLYSSRDCSVTTETPQSFREFIDQRLRWIGKTGDIKDNLSTILAVVQAVLTIGFFGLLIWSMAVSNWKGTALLLGLKSITDLFLFFPYFNRVKRLTSWVFIPIYEILFPIYTLIILVLLFTYKPKWKGRKIYAD